jgi:peptidoglycan/LPS O-acetylase OafA/YrhL
MAGAESSFLSHARFTATRTFGSLNGLRCPSILAVVRHQASLRALVGAFAVSEDDGLESLLTLRPIERIRAVSYGIYLYPLVALNIVTRLGAGAASNPLRFLSRAIASLALAELIDRVLEMRFLRRKGRFEASGGR